MSTTEETGVEAPDRLAPRPPAGAHDRRLVRMAVWGETPLDRGNRLFMGLLGAVLVAAGVLTLLLNTGAISTTAPGVVYGRLVRDARGATNLSAAIACAICLIIAVLAAGWALAQLRPVSDGERVDTVRLARGQRGRTTMAATTLTKAATADLMGRQGITAARVRLRAAKPIPRVQATVEVALDADVEAALAEVSDTMGRLIAALGAKPEEADTEIRLRFARTARQLRTSRTA